MHINTGVIIIITNASHSLKASLKACNLLGKLGGPLVTQSCEEVYALLVSIKQKHLQQQQQRKLFDRGGFRDGTCVGGAHDDLVDVPIQPRDTYHKVLTRAHSLILP